MNLSEHPLYEYFEKRLQRSQSPVREDVAKMSPQKLEEKLNVTISKGLFGRLFGRYNEKDVEIARRIFEVTPSNVSDKPSNVSLVYLPSEQPHQPPRPYSPSEFRLPKYTPASEAAAAKAAEAQAKLPRTPITQDDINAAKREVDDLRIRRVYGHNLSPDYFERSLDHDIATQKLQKMFEEQQRKTGAKGGKSKRVKSKRNKRSTKRRNARK